MAGRYSPKAQIQINALYTMSEKVQHVHGMVERYAVTKDPKEAERMGQPLKRAFGKLKLDLMGAGFDNMSQLAGAMEIASGRSGPPRNKIRILREGVGSLRFQVEQEQRRIAAEDEREQRRAAEKEAARQADQGSG